MTKYILFFLLNLAIFACSNKNDKNKSINKEALQNAILAGENIYKNHCISCHMADGKGSDPMNPPIRNSKYVNGPEDVFVQIILLGSEAGPYPIDDDEYLGQMRSHNFLSDENIATVMTYIKNNFDNDGGLVDTKTVTQVRKSLIK